MAKVNNKTRGRMRDVKHAMLLKTINRKKNLIGCSRKSKV